MVHRNRQAGGEAGLQEREAFYLVQLERLQDFPVEIVR